MKPFAFTQGLGAVFAVVAVLLSGVAHADNLRTSGPAPKAYAAECGACHTAFPAGLLSARDWTTTLAELPRHFGTDASVTAAELAEISSFLASNAAANGDRYTSSTKPPRLTKTAWFERKHVRKLPADVWTNPKVKSAANCVACHTQANSGGYAERDISVPGYAGRHW